MTLRTSMMLALAAAAAALLPGTEARAEFGIFDFASAVTDPAGGSAALPAGGSLAFAANSGSNIDGTLSGGADIIIGTIDYVPADTPTASTAYSTDFQYTVTLTDQDSGLTGDVTVTGTFTGFYKGGDAPSINAQLMGTYLVNPTSLDIGGTTYLVATAQSSGPGSVTDPGVLRINVTAVPEPGSMALVGVGLAGLAGLGWRRRRRAS